MRTLISKIPLLYECGTGACMEAMHRRGACAEKVDFDMSLREADSAGLTSGDDSVVGIASYSEAGGARGILCEYGASIEGGAGAVKA
jgi:hypothetical protein